MKEVIETPNEHLSKRDLAVIKQIAAVQNEMIKAAISVLDYGVCGRTTNALLAAREHLHGLGKFIIKQY